VDILASVGVEVAIDRVGTSLGACLGPADEVAGEEHSWDRLVQISDRLGEVPDQCVDEVDPEHPQVRPDECLLDQCTAGGEEMEKLQRLVGLPEVGGEAIVVDQLSSDLQREGLHAASGVGVELELLPVVHSGEDLHQLGIDSAMLLTGQRRSESQANVVEAAVLDVSEEVHQSVGSLRSQSVHHSQGYLFEGPHVASAQYEGDHLVVGEACGGTLTGLGSTVDS